MKSINIVDITDIRLGRVTANFHRLGDNIESNFCFSIITKRRTLDIVCSTQTQVDSWVHGMQYLRGRLHSEQGFVSFSQREQDLDNRARLALQWSVVARLQRGAHLLKHTPRRMHERYFQLSQDMRQIHWTSEEYKLKKVKKYTVVHKNGVFFGSLHHDISRCL
jgi:hypothetical protein